MNRFWIRVNSNPAWQIKEVFMRYQTQNSLLFGGSTPPAHVDIERVGLRQKSCGYNLFSSVSNCCYSDKQLPIKNKQIPTHFSHIVTVLCFFQFP